METLEVNAMREQIIDITIRVTGLSRKVINANLPLSKIGIDSLMALSVVAAIEKQLKINIQEKRLRGIKSINDLVAVVMDRK